VKILASDKVFFHFFQNILNARRHTFVAPSSHFLPFYWICHCLPSKKLRKNCPLFNTRSKWNAAALSRIEKYFLGLNPAHTLSTQLHSAVARP
jgi:hypothetical protein